MSITLDAKIVTVVQHGFKVTIHDCGLNWIVVYNNGEIEDTYSKSEYTAQSATCSTAMKASRNKALI